MEKFKERYIKYLPSYLYGLAIVVITLIPYVPSNYFVIIAAVFGMFGLYALFDKVSDKGKKRLSVLAYFLSFLLLFFAFSTSINGTPFYMWLLTGYDYNPIYIPYVVVLYFICILFAGATVFYFTYFYFRGYIMIFLLLIPVALYYKMIESVPVIYIIFVLLALVVLYIVEKQKLRLKDKHIEMSKTTWKFFGFIGILVLIIGVLTPKSDMAKYRDIFDEVVAMNPFTSRNINSIGYVTDKSSSSSYGFLNQNRLLYTVNSYEPLYLRRTAFGRYDGEYWVVEDKSTTSNWNLENESMNMRTFYENMISLYDSYQEVFEEYGILREDIPNVTEESLNAVITPKQFYTNYYLGTVRTFNVESVVEENSSLTLGMNNYGCLQYIDNTRNSIGRNSYTIEYYSDIARSNEAILHFAQKFQGEAYYNFIVELRDKCQKNDDILDGWLEVIERQLSIGIGDSKINADYSDKIKELALQITKNATTDYEKAEALEAYFKENGYVYNLSYEPADNSIDYFIFESKTGACGQYATAMTLMANAIGLNARYTEGFVMSQQYDDGSYYITAGNSHAYVEVYIPGYGYTIFEPTVGSSENTLSGTLSGIVDRFSDVVEIGADTVSYLIVVAIVVMILVILFNKLLFDKIKDKLKVAKCNASKDKTKTAYTIFQSMLGNYTKSKVNTMTPMEFAAFVMECYQVDLTPLTNALMRRIYENSNIEVSEEFINNIPKYCQTIRERNKLNKKEEKKKKKLKIKQ